MPYLTPGRNCAKMPVERDRPASWAAALCAALLHVGLFVVKLNGAAIQPSNPKRSFVLMTIDIAIPYRALELEERFLWRVPPHELIEFGARHLSGVGRRVHKRCAGRQRLTRLRHRHTDR